MGTEPTKLRHNWDSLTYSLTARSDLLYIYYIYYIAKISLVALLKLKQYYQGLKHMDNCRRWLERHIKALT